MMNEAGVRRTLPEQSSGSVHTFGTPRHSSVTNPILSKRVCFYKSGDPQFSGLLLVINNRTFKTFDALLDSLSKKVPLPFGVRNITTPRGVHAINSLNELEDGKSYICSDRRKVKPINLAVARKKLPPWYNARPVSSRRRTVQQARFFPGRSIHRPEPVVVRTPKRLLVFRNGDPTVKHTVVLHKKAVPSYESILGYISELMQFHVVKLHTPDGKRVEGLPGLILCSGTVVAVGMEPFRPAIYRAQKSPAPTRRQTNQMALRGQRALNYSKGKKKPLSYVSKSRNFSPSSERYIVHQIHNAGISRDIPSNLTNSVELESNHMLESVAETEEDTCLGDRADRQDCMLPNEDDIEKSFRVNQDGSMTVEMRVRLTIKEEETVHWTTTVSRSSVANQLSSLPEPEAEQEICSPKSNSLDLQSPASSIDVINKDKTKDNNDEDPPSLSNGAFSESQNEEDEIKSHSDLVSHTRAPTPGHIKISEKQASVESIKSVTADGIQEGMVGSYSYREQTENGTMTQQYCMVKQSSTRPVPKPRRLGSVDTNSRNVSAFKSAEMAEILRIESSGEEVTETVLHLYEQQTCQDNFHANVYAHDMAASGITFGRPVTSETGQLSSNNEFEPELWRPSTASESISVWRAESISLTPDLILPSLNIGANQATNRQQQLQKPTKGHGRLQQREASKDRKVSPKTKVVNKRVQRVATPIKRQKDNPAGATETRKKLKTFSSAGFLKRIYGNKSKSAKSMKKLKKRPTQNGDGGVTTESVELSDDTVTCAVKDPNIPSVLRENTSQRVSPTELSQPRGILTRQTSMHREKSEKKSSDIRESMSLPAFNSSSSVTNEYVENWLEKAHLNQQTENGRCGKPENKHDSITGAEEAKCLEETSKTCQTSEPPPESLLATSVKLRVRSFENKSSSPSVEKTTASQQNVHNHTTTKDTESCKSFSQQNIEEITPPSNSMCSEIIPPADKTSTEMPLGSEVENKSSPVRISLQKATPFSTLSMDLPPPPPPEEYTELSDTEYCTKDVPSVASSPLYRLSSRSSQRTDNHPLSISPTSDKAMSPTDNKMDITSFQTDIPSTLKEAPLTRTPSIKRAPLVSNLSLERKMSLRKACVDNYTLSSGATSETATLPTPINTVSDDALPNEIGSTATQQPIKAPPEETRQSILDMMSRLSGCTSVSPASLISEERMSSASISSSEASVPSSLSLKETKLTEKEASSPTTSVKKAKPVSSPSPERKIQNKKSSLEVQNNSSQLSAVPESCITSPNVGIVKHATPNASSSTERKQKLYKPKSQKRPSPYSQSLDMVSPPVRHKSSRKMLSKNLSSDDTSEPANRTQRKASAQRKSHKTPQSIKSTAELAKALTSGTLMPLQADQSDEKADLVTTDQEKSNMQITPQPSNTANQPNMKPVLEKICYSIKSIRQITQNKRPSCLEKSNSLPDFSSHVASTFGSSSKALLAFLSVMTLKEGISNLNMEELNANDVSCAEALKMIDSLREIASIEDSQKLKSSLSNLQQSASKQLLQSWKGFQEFGDRCKSRSSTPNGSEHELIAEACPEQDIEENVIDEIMDNLDIPEKLKEELASLSVGAKADNEDNMAAGVNERVSPKENSDENTNHFSTEDALHVQDVTQDDKTNVDVRSIIKKFSDINQEKPPGKASIHLMTETGKHRATGQPTKDNDDQYEQNSGTKCPPGGTPEERQLHSKASFVRENKEDLQSCRDAEHEDNQEECRQLQMQREESQSIPENELGSDEEGQKTPSANNDLAQRESCNSEEGEQHSSDEEEAEVPCEEIKQERSEDEDLSNNESHSEEEEYKQQSSEYNVEVNERGEKSSAEEEQLDVECKELSNNDDSSIPVCLSNSEKELQSPTFSMGLNVSVDESTENSDASSEEELPEVAFKELQVIVEESSSGLEDEEEAMEEEHFHYLPDDGKQTKTFKELKAVMEESEEDEVSSGAEDLHTDESQVCDKTKSPVDRDLYTKTDDSSLIKSDSLERRYRVNTDDDSGNDHSSCEEHVDEEQTTVDDEQISSSIEEELSYYEKEFSSEEEQANVDRCMEESRTQHQEAPSLEIQTKVTTCEKTVEKLEHQSGEVISQSVAERVIVLEKQVAEAQKNTTSSAIRHFSQRNVPLESDVEDSPSEASTSPPALCTRSAPQSSLSFSYDSSGVITTEPEGNRVRSIREMFLAKSATDIQQRRFPSPNTEQLSESRADTSGSGGYQSQTSSELSSGEDDSARKSITKGFVRRTIERLYGKKDANPDEEAGERPPPEQKQKKKEHSSIFSPFHTARSKAMSELSYFNSSNALDTLSEATRCIAFNAQVGPGDSVPIDDGRWLLRENTVIRKSVSDPVGINKSFTNTPEDEGVCKDTEENTPYSLFSTQSEQEDKTKAFSRKCTYFSLPHASDSDACQDDLSTASKSSMNGDSVMEAKDASEDATMWAERNGKLPGISDFKMMDNKVHPLVELPPGEVVVVQPGRGHGVVNRFQEPDVLDLLYNFCGQHCPIL